jgi:uncharacterized membrane protein
MKALVKYISLALVLLLCSPNLYAVQAALSVDTTQAASDNDPIYDTANWKAHVFYFNKNDNRLFPPKPNGMGWTINFSHPLAGVMLVAFVLLLVAFVYFTRRASIASTKTQDPIKEDENYKLGIFYYNKNDTRIFPPKRSGLGWTVNFANPLSIAILLAIVGGILLMEFLLIKYG